MPQAALLPSWRYGLTARFLRLLPGSHSGARKPKRANNPPCHHLDCRQPADPFSYAGYFCTAVFDALSCRRGDPTAAGVLAACQIAEDCGDGGCSIGIATTKGFHGQSRQRPESNTRREYCALGSGRRMAAFLCAVRGDDGEVIVDTKTMEVVDDQVIDGRIIAEARQPIKDRSPEQHSQPPVPIFVLQLQKEALTIGLWAGRFSSRWEMAKPCTIGREEIFATMAERTSALLGIGKTAEKEAEEVAEAAAAAQEESKDVEEAMKALEDARESGDLEATQAAEEHLRVQQEEAALAAEKKEQEWLEAEEAAAMEEIVPVRARHRCVSPTECPCC